MGKYANFYNSKNGDRKYDASSFEEWLKPFFNNGVFNGEMLVSSGGGFDIKVAIGNAYINGKLRKFDDITTLTVEKSSSTLARIDNLVVRRNDTDRNFTLEVVKGVESASPVAPALVRENGVYDLCLARIYVGASVVEITQANITDTRMDSNLCGYVCATVDQIDFDQITLQWEEYLKEFKASNLAEFEEWEEAQQAAITLWEINYKSEFDVWFEKIKGQLSEDAAGKLQLEINDLQAVDKVMADMFINNNYRCLITDESDNYIVDEFGYAILANWKYKEV